ncbi:MAG TPA: N-6 DNA methylase [Verrucomicrobiae bacterium]|nr:N-6 DNA methylase [Verrucomicrobiae bacterium]
MTSNELYNRFNRGLLDLRETFHRTGRLDDSNTKLDEIVKLLSIEIAQLHGAKGIPPLKDVLFAYRTGRIKSLVGRLNEMLVHVAQSPIFVNTDGESLLGLKPSLSIPDSEAEIAEKIVDLVVNTFNGSLRQVNSNRNFELLNEAFGHFVRDNFRNNIEDAQYMTPPEVVSYMCNLAVEEIRHQHSKGPFTVIDPSCGVGSFLAQFYSKAIHDAKLAELEIRLVGQDKVDRMARLTKLNLMLFNTVRALIYRGNSLVGDSPLDSYSGRCDLILTNPPFGARFSSSDLRASSRLKYPLLHDIIETSTATIDSELLFLDRYYALLKPGGTVLAVVPDAIISAAGLPTLVRDRLAKNFVLRSITELPSVTFGQAGTRTKTCVLHMQKMPATEKKTFIAISNDLGFDVASRKGVPIKKPNGGVNDLETIQRHFSDFSHGKAEGQILSEEPSCVITTFDRLSRDGWTPNHHSARRYKTLSVLSSKSKDAEFSPVRLGDLVLQPECARAGQQSWDELFEEPGLQISKADDRWHEPKCISVLHVGDFGFLNIRELMHYKPKYPGQPCYPGDVLFSKINPRIPRVLVVPNFPAPLTCSNEFEVLRVKEDVSPFKLALLLLSAFAQNQILSLTSGTSSSHNRIKYSQLIEIKLPIPAPGSSWERKLNALSNSFQDSQVNLHQSAYDSYNSMSKCDDLLYAMVK